MSRTGALLALAAVVCLIPLDTARAQTPGPVEAGGGVAFLGSDDLIDGFAGGWFVEGGWRSADWLTLVVEVGRHRVTQDVGFLDTDVTFDTAVAGARVRFGVAGLRPYGHFLVGAARLALVARTTTPVATAGADAATHPVLQLGGGLETPLRGRLRLRIGADYRRVSTDRGLDQVRVSTGLIWGF